jgi:hypothetical protein
MEGGAEVEAVTPQQGPAEVPPEVVVAGVLCQMRGSTLRPERAAWAVEPRAWAGAREQVELPGRQEQGDLRL